MAPKISVIVPVFNARQHIEGAFAMLLDQGLGIDELEIVLVDDCSDDDSLAECERVASGRPGTIVVGQPENKGAGAARNAGLDAAHGEYIYFFDVDDLLEPGSLAKLHDRAVRDDLDVLFFSAEVAYEYPELEQTDPQNAEYFRRRYAGGPVGGRDMFIWQVDHEDFCAQPCVQLTRRSVVEEHAIRFPEGMINEDNIYVIATTLAARRCDAIPDAPYTYVVHPNSVTTRESKKRWRHYDAHLRMFDYVFERAYAAQAEGDLELTRALCSLGDLFNYWGEFGLFDVGNRPENHLSSDRSTLASLHAIFLRMLSQREGRLQAEGRIAQLEQEIQTLNDRIAELESSTTWKAGRAVTAVPRRIKDLLGGRRQ